MTREMRAHQIWQVLLTCATNAQTITYTELATAIGMGGPGVLAGPLDCIYCYCDQHRLPRLTVLVVSNQTGRPEGPDGDYGDIDRTRQDVFAHEWFKDEPPTAADFAAAFDAEYV